jgi:signal transduction histidine kinase/HPt (histidine-containing phosphotransfer) domain-containing protein/ActR/RegA family two-component response regulator
MRQLHDLIAASEGWLTTRIIHYAKELGYTPFTSTLEQAWRASIHGLSAPILEALAESRSLSAVRAEADYARDPIAFYGIEAARRHRTRGITLGLFLGLMKSYRHAYLDLAETLDVSPEVRAHHRSVIDNFFDRMEVGFCDEWAGRPTDVQVDDLARQNRLITNEKNKYLTIFESLNDPAILIGIDGGIENINFAASSLFLATDAPGAVYYGDRRPSIVEVIGFDPLGATDVAFEREIETAVGRRWFDVRTQRMLDVSEKYLGTVVILVDITEHRRAKEEAQRADRAKSGFLATMSHEIRTPIHGILGLAELLGERPLGHQEKEWVEAIARSGEILSSVVADILDYSKIEAGVLELEEVEFAVGSVVEDVFGLMQPIAHRKPDLALVLETPRLPTIVGDPGKLRQILLNLVGNAIKFTDRGTVWLAVQEIVEPGPTWMLRFVVADTGIGIAADRQQKIFEPFTQSDGSVARRYGGTGLGLAICRSLVHRIGGEIGVSSRPGEGSRFWFTMPFEPIAGRAPLPSGRPPEEVAPLARLDVLVVEDNEVNAMVASGLLERAGHRATVATTGGAAIERILAGDHDLVLMDLRLPDIDGIETTRRIRALADRRKAATPIVALSAQVVKADIDACLEAGMNDFLGKPFHLERLESTLRRVIGATATSVPAPAPTPRPTDGAELDERVLDGHLAALGAETTGRIVATFLATTADLADRLDRLDHGDDRPLAEIAHRLKSSSLHVGLVRLSARAAEIETRIATGAAVAPGTAAALASDCRRAITTLDRAWSERREDQPAKT